MNEGENFAKLRQIYNSLILAIWFKDKVRESIFGQTYINQKKTGGIDVEDKAVKDKIWNQYVAAFKQGVYDYIKEDYDPVTEQVVARRYFSGGAGFSDIRSVYQKTGVAPEKNNDSAMLVRTNINPINVDGLKAQTIVLKRRALQGNVITIDGLSGSGKTAVARSLAHKLNYKYLSIGHIYRAITLTCLKKGIDVKDYDKVDSFLSQMDIEAKAASDGFTLFINGWDASAFEGKDLESQDITQAVAFISRHKKVHEVVLQNVRDIGEAGNIVIEGRVAGTIVFPDKENVSRVYLTASIDTRSERRAKDYHAKGLKISIDNVRKEILTRDSEDINNPFVPFRRAADTYEVKTDNLTEDEVVDLVVENLDERSSAPDQESRLSHELRRVLKDHGLNDFVEVEFKLGMVYFSLAKEKFTEEQKEQIVSFIQSSALNDLFNELALISGQPQIKASLYYTLFDIGYSSPNYDNPSRAYMDVMSFVDYGNGLFKSPKIKNVMNHDPRMKALSAILSKYKTEREKDSPLRILVVGPGTGVPIQVVRDALPDAMITGLDIEENVVTHLKKRFQQDANINILHGDATNAEGIKDGSFDIIIGDNVLKFIALAGDNGLENYAGELKRMVSSDGIILNLDAVGTDQMREKFGKFLKANQLNTGEHQGFADFHRHMKFFIMAYYYFKLADPLFRQMINDMIGSNISDESVVEFLFDFAGYKRKPVFVTVNSKDQSSFQVSSDIVDEVLEEIGREADQVSLTWERALSPAQQSVMAAWQRISDDIKRQDPHVAEKTEPFLSRFYFAMQNSMRNILKQAGEGEIDPFVSMKFLSTDGERTVADSRFHEVDREVKVGFFPVAANPLNIGHMEGAFVAIDALSLDRVAVRVQGEIRYKNLPETDRVPVKDRHEIVQRVLRDMSPLLNYTDLGSEPDNEKEGFEELLRFLDLNKDRKMHAYYLIGIENKERVLKYTRQFYELVKKYGYGSNGKHKISIGWIRRGEYGAEVSLEEIQLLNEQIASDMNAKIRLNVETVPCPELNVSSTYYRNTHDAGFVPQQVDVWAKAHGFYGHPPIDPRTGKPYKISEDERFRERLRPVAESIANQIVRLQERKSGGKTMVVGLDGPSGSGKTTVIEEVAKYAAMRGEDFVQIGLDMFLRDKLWRMAVEKSVLGMPLSEEEKKLVGDFVDDVNLGEDYVNEELFFDQKAILELMQKIKEFADSDKEEMQIVIPDAYIRGEDRRLDVSFTLKKGMIIFIDGKYAFREELQKFYDVRYRLNDHPDRTKAKFEMRTRSLSPNTADQQMRFYSKGLIPSWEEYVSRISDHEVIQGVVDLSTDEWSVKDPAMLSRDKVGGIDLTRDRLDLEVQSDGEATFFNFDPAMLRQLQNSSGLTPVIIDMVPVNNVLPFLGLSSERKPDAVSRAKGLEFSMN